MANRKFVRGLEISTPGTVATPYLMKLCYELWGYVLYGASTPTAPAAGAFPATNPNNYPTNALEGTSVQATGTNGSTTNGSNIFTSAGASFNSGMIGSVLTMWVPGSGSTDDGLYLITGVPSATQLQINVSNGGHPDPTTHLPVLNTRGSINYRVVNYSVVGSLSWASTNYLIFQLNPSASDNPNASQATSQVQCLMNGTGTTSGINMIGSPAGTWTGAAFTDAMSGVTTTTNSGGFDFWNPTCYTITADFDGILCWFKGLNGFGTSNIYFEAPSRVGTYPGQTSDQNPLAISTDGIVGVFTSSTTQSFNNFHMAGSDNVTRLHRMQVKTMTGDGNAANGFGNNTIVSGSGINDVRLAYAFGEGSTMVSAIMLGQITTSATNFTRCRAFLKAMSACSSVVPILHKLGSNGQYLHIQNGVCMAWDNTTLATPNTLIPFGF